MIIFDGSNRDQCEVKRLKTNTPLQALVMMNDPTVLEASRVLSQNLIKESSAPHNKIAKAFRLIICRKPGEQELQILKSYFDEQLQLFKQKKLDAEATLKQGEYEKDETVNKVLTAALMKTISTIYNLEEAITKS